MDGEQAAVEAAVTGPTRVLVVDDSRTQRVLLRALLQRRGYEVHEAADGEAALDVIERLPISLVVSDWMMPRMTGPELCQALRARGPAQHYVYIILVTAKHEAEDLSLGLGAGADDYLRKPIEETELLARLRTGERHVSLDAQLRGQMAATRRALDEANALYARLERDLAAASLLQREFFPPPEAFCNGARCAALSRPSGHVGGDLVGYFAVGTGGLGVFGIDVCGHGVASALRAVHLSQLLAPAWPEANIAFARGPGGELELRDPAEVITDLNRRFADAAGESLFFTMGLAILDLDTGSGRYVCAGHARPAILRRGGAVDLLESAGPPAGLLPRIAYRSEDFTLDPGDRLLIASDGLLGARSPDGRLVEERTLYAHAATAGGGPGQALAALVSTIERVTGSSSFEDDISAVIVERPAAPG